MPRNRTSKAEKAIKRYSYGIIGFCILGATYVHLPQYWWGDWTMYKKFGMWGSIIIHFFEVPVILLNLYVSYFGIKSFTWDNRVAYISMRHSVFAVNTVFIALECVQFFFSFPLNAPPWEKISYGIIVVMMFGAISYLFYLMRLLDNYAPLDVYEQDGHGFYHPDSEEDLVKLVKLAARKGVKIRVRGAAHSLAHAIYAAPATYENKVSVQRPPESGDMNVMLDCYTGFRWIDETNGLVEVDAGIHLGIDPNDPQRRSTVQNSLLYQAAELGFTLDDLGGITHQTISGFLLTGSAGGSLKYSVEDNIEAFSIIDGQGRVEWFWKGEDHFYALLCSFGIQGIISKVQLRLKRMYIIQGEERTVALPEISADLFSTPQPRALENFLRNYDYARLLWWPQPGVERVVVWTANRREPVPVGFKPKPYCGLSPNRYWSLIQQLLGSLVFTVLGEPGFFIVIKKMMNSRGAVGQGIYELFGRNMLSWMCASLTSIILIALQLIALIVLYPLKWIQVRGGPLLATKLVQLFQKLTKRGEEQYFEDYPHGSLPMDNGYNDTLIGTEFTELWIPINEGPRAMNFFKDMYERQGFKACGYYATEIYAARESQVWMSPAYHTDVLRIDLFWFTNNAGDPSAKGGFFNQFWEGLRRENIPFRLHWGKFLPGYAMPPDPHENYRSWAQYLKSVYPKWDDFMALRKQRDPKGIFLTDYWYMHLHG